MLRYFAGVPVGTKRSAQTKAKPKTYPGPRKGDDKAKGGDQQKPTGEKAEGKDDGGFTAAQDAAIITAKKEGKKSWADIAKDIGKEKWQVQARWKEINPDKGAEQQKNAAGNADAKGGGKTEEKQQGEKKEKGGGGGGERVKETPANRQMVELKADGNFSFDELSDLCDILRRDQEALWLRVASAFFDRTGRRLRPGDIEEKFTE